MEESSKSAVLSDLYAVRAAMSLISENDDKTQERYDRINQLNADIDGYNQRIEDLEQTRRAELKPYETQTAIDDLNNEKAKLEKERELLQEKHDKKMRDLKLDFSDDIKDNGFMFVLLELVGLLLFAPIPILLFIIFAIQDGISAKRCNPKFKKSEK